MLDTLMILSMAPGTRSRRASGFHRAVPVLLPKQKQAQALEQRPPQRLARPSSQQPPRPAPQKTPQQTPPQRPQSSPSSQSSQSPPQQQQPPFSITTSTRSIQNILNHASSMRGKRKIDFAKHVDPDPARKRAKLAVEILSKPPTTPNAAAPPARAAAPASTPAVPPATAAIPPPKQGLRSAPPPVAPTTAPSVLPRPAADSSRTTASQLAAKAIREKAANGVKLELRGLQASATSAAASATGPAEGGRKLRSQEASRFKSELSAYFPDYDEVIGNEPKEEHILNIDTPILFAESTAAHPDSNAVSTALIEQASSSIRGYGDALFFDLADSHVVDFGFLANQLKGKRADDPLPDAYFEPHHKRAERLERSIRNSEKGRAQHEKDQIIRLLEGLQGPDWLRTMGVSGITEGKKRSFEPARAHFIRGCRAILEKFRLWSAEEKRRKLEKDRIHAEGVRAREEAEGITRVRGRGKGKTARPAVLLPGPPGGKRRRNRISDGSGSVDKESQDAEEGVPQVGEDEDELADDESQPDSSDVDAVIAKQLRAEALSRSRIAAARAAAGSKKRRKAPRSSSSSSECQELALPSKEPPHPRELTSFFEKPYQREAALSRNRRKGRKVLAWGQPVPEPAVADFDLPDNLLDEETMKVLARRKRRDKREGRK